MPRSKADQRGAVGEALLDPVEAAEVAAEVVDHVHERGLARARDHRAAVLELAVVAEDDVEHGLGGGGREALDARRSRVRTRKYPSGISPRSLPASVSSMACPVQA